MYCIAELSNVIIIDKYIYNSKNEGDVRAQGKNQKDKSHARFVYFIQLNIRSNCLQMLGPISVILLCF